MSTDLTLPAIEARRVGAGPLGAVSSTRVQDTLQRIPVVSATQTDFVTPVVIDAIRGSITTASFSSFPTSGSTMALLVHNAEVHADSNIVVGLQMSSSPPLYHLTAQVVSISEGTFTVYIVNNAMQLRLFNGVTDSGITGFYANADSTPALSGTVNTTTGAVTNVTASLDSQIVVAPIPLTSLPGTVTVNFIVLS